MAKLFPAALQLRTLEQKQVAFMLATGFFMGAFIATYQVTADSLFLNRLGDFLERAFLITGFLGILSTGVFSFLQNYIRFSLLTTLVVFSILLFTVGVYYLLHFGNPDWHDAVIFAMFCSSGPIIAVLLLSYWGTFGRLFNFRQSKNIIGWIDTGQLVAAILASFLIPLSAKLIPDTTDYLFVCAASILAVGILLFTISVRFSLTKNDPREFGAEVRRETRMTKILSDPYIRMMSMLLFLSMTVFVFTQFSFQEMVRIQYPDQRELTNFNAFFIGAVYALSLVMQTFVNSRIISNYGLRTSLMLLPVIVGILSFGSVVAGTVFGFDKLISPAGFIYFFLFVAMSRLFNWTLRESLENPVFKLFFIPLDSKLRFSVQSKVEGLVNESSRFVGGLMIFGLAFIPAFEVIHISAGLVLLSVIYLVVVGRLYAGYRSKIRLKLESSDLQQDKLEKGFTQITERLENNLKEPYPGRAVFSYKMLEKMNAGQVSVWVNDLIRNGDDSVRHFAQERMNELKGLSVSDRYVIRMDRNKIQASEKIMLARPDIELILKNGGNITKARIQRLARSTDVHDRHYAAELILHTDGEECLPFLVELLNDPDPKVRSTAISSSVRKHNNEIINALVDNLANPRFGNQAMNALVAIGAKTLPSLDASFYRGTQNNYLLLRIVQTMGRISGQRAKELLWNKIDYPNKVIVSQVLLSLGETGFKANISQVTRIKYAIESDIAEIRWNLSAIQEVGSDGFNGFIVSALRSEIYNDIEHIYMLLAMLYDTRSIQLVKENIDSGTSEGITYAVELLDVFLSEQLKQRVIPVLDEISETERINRLDVFYPRMKLDSLLVLKFIINRDFTQSNRWTKACVIYKIGQDRIGDFKLDLMAHMYNPDTLIREVAAWALYQLSEAEYHDHAVRLGVAAKKELDDLLYSSRLSKFSKVLFFKGIQAFSEVPGITLTYLADICEEFVLKERDSLVLDDRTNTNFYVIVRGEVDFFQKGELVSTFSEGQFIGELLGLPSFLNTNLVVARTDTSMLRMDKDQFYELLTGHVRLADKISEFV